MDALDLTPEQLNVINAEIQRVKDEVVGEAKVDFRAGVAGCKKSTEYDPTTMNIVNYLTSWEHYKSIMNLRGGAAINTFLTYLDMQSRATIADKEINTGQEWDTFKEEAIAALSTPTVGVQARFQLKRAKQKAEETIIEFGRRLQELGRVGYRPDEEALKENILKDALTSGLWRDEIAIALINEPTWNYQRCLDHAITMEASYQAREAAKD